MSSYSVFTAAQSANNSPSDKLPPPSGPRLTAGFERRELADDCGRVFDTAERHAAALSSLAMSVLDSLPTSMRPIEASDTLRADAARLRAAADAAMREVLDLRGLAGQLEALAVTAERVESALGVASRPRRDRRAALAALCETKG